MKCPSQTRVKRKKGRETEKKTANEQICLREDMSTDTLSRKIYFIYITYINYFDVT